ncbi:MAG TPA: hypothetical protein VG733_17215 [Chthoniobacteraceae bacterium]|nr:hypothetical protein [Chthoniobacteraceae bacterium]
MDDTPASIAALRKEIAQLSQGVKLGFLALLIGASYFNIRTAIFIPKFALIFKDMLGSEYALPVETLLVVRGCQFLVVLACIIPAIGIATLWASSAYQAIRTLAILLFVAILQYHLTWWALGQPLIAVIKRMSSNEP